MQLDLRTLVFCMSIMSASTCLVLFFLCYHGYEKKSTFWWGVGAFFSALGSMAIFLRGYIPLTPSVALGNLGHFLGFAFMWHGIRFFLGKKGHLKWVIIIPSIPIPFLLYFAVISPSLITRFIICLITISFINSLTSWELWHVKEKMSRVMRNLYFFTAAFYLLWLFVLIQAISTNSFVHSGLATISLYIFGCIFNLFYIVGMTMMINDRLTMKLKSARDDAEFANTAKTEFLAHMSHEIRTPLNSVIGMTELLQLTKLDTTQQDYARTLKLGSEALLDIINDILDFSKIESGAKELNKERFNLKQCIMNEYKLFTPRAKEKGITLKCEISPLPDFFYGDDSCIRQILSNLIGNAIKFTQKGNVSLQVKGTPKDNNQWQLTFIISDTGIGFAEKTKKIIFNSFSQANTSITRRFGGSGLGLAICKNLVTLLDGKITAYSSGSGQGARFEVTFPLEKIQEGPTTTDESIDDLQHYSNMFSGNILVIEDSKLNQQVADYMLSTMGCKVTLAHNGLSALKMLEKLSLDIIITDIQMPEMDGFEFTKKIRLSKDYQNIPILAMTATASSENQQKCISSGINTIISKPVTFQKLANALNNYLPKSKPIPQKSVTELKAPPPSTVTSGLDVDFALKKLANNRTLYHKMLRMSLDVGFEVYDAALTELHNNNPSAASNHIHALKGMCWSIGANQLAGICEQIEETLKTTQDLDNDTTQNFEQHVSSLKKEITQYLHDQNGT